MSDTKNNTNPGEVPQEVSASVPSAGSEASPKPKIFVFVNSGAGTDFQCSVAVAEDGTGLAGHASSSIGWAKHDMGFGSNWKHEEYNKHYPQGWELVWVDNPKTDPALLAAIEKNRALAALSQATEAAK